MLSRSLTPFLQDKLIKPPGKHPIKISCCWQEQQRTKELKFAVTTDEWTGRKFRPQDAIQLFEEGMNQRTGTDRGDMFNICADIFAWLPNMLCLFEKWRGMSFLSTTTTSTKQPGKTENNKDKEELRERAKTYTGVMQQWSKTHTCSDRWRESQRRGERTRERGRNNNKGGGESDVWSRTWTFHLHQSSFSCKHTNNSEHHITRPWETQPWCWSLTVTSPPGSEPSNKVTQRRCVLQDHSYKQNKQENIINKDSKKSPWTFNLLLARSKK